MKKPDGMDIGEQDKQVKAGIERAVALFARTYKEISETAGENSLFVAGALAGMLRATAVRSGKAEVFDSLAKLLSEDITREKEL